MHSVLIIVEKLDKPSLQQSQNRQQCIEEFAQLALAHKSIEIIGTGSLLIRLNGGTDALGEADGNDALGEALMLANRSSQNHRMLFFEQEPHWVRSAVVLAPDEAPGAI